MAAGQASPALPTVALVGDSIRLGYAPLVDPPAGRGGPRGQPAAQRGDSARVLQHLEEWVLRERPDVVHLNCGLHDLKRSKETGAYQVPLAQYEANLREIVERLRRGRRPPSSSPPPPPSWTTATPSGRRTSTAPRRTWPATTPSPCA